MKLKKKLTFSNIYDHCIFEFTSNYSLLSSRIGCSQLKTTPKSILCFDKIFFIIFVVLIYQRNLIIRSCFAAFVLILYTSYIPSPQSLTRSVLTENNTDVLETAPWMVLMMFTSILHFRVQQIIPKENSSANMTKILTRKKLSKDSITGNRECKYYFKRIIRSTPILLLFCVFSAKDITSQNSIFLMHAIKFSTKAGSRNVRHQ